MPLPLDRYRCGGCGQLLTFDGAVRVPMEQLKACQGRCDWLLVERSGEQVTPDPGPDHRTR